MVSFLLMQVGALLLQSPPSSQVLTESPTNLYPKSHSYVASDPGVSPLVSTAPFSGESNSGQGTTKSNLFIYCSCGMVSFLLMQVGALLLQSPPSSQVLTESPTNLYPKSHSYVASDPGVSPLVSTAPFSGESNSGQGTTKRNLFIYCSCGMVSFLLMQVGALLLQSPPSSQVLTESPTNLYPKSHSYVASDPGVSPLVSTAPFSGESNSGQGTTKRNLFIYCSCGMVSFLLMQVGALLLQSPPSSQVLTESPTNLYPKSHSYVASDPGVSPLVSTAPFSGESNSGQGTTKRNLFIYCSCGMVSFLLMQVGALLLQSPPSSQVLTESPTNLYPKSHSYVASDPGVSPLVSTAPFSGESNSGQGTTKRNLFIYCSCGMVSFLLMQVGALLLQSPPSSQVLTESPTNLYPKSHSYVASDPGVSPLVSTAPFSGESNSGQGMT